MGHFVKKLDMNQFLRCHNSHLINVKQVKKVGKSKSNYLIMSNEDVVPVSASKRVEIEKALGL